MNYKKFYLDLTNLSLLFHYETSAIQWSQLQARSKRNETEEELRLSVTYDDSWKVRNSLVSMRFWHKVLLLTLLTERTNSPNFVIMISAFTIFITLCLSFYIKTLLQILQRNFMTLLTFITSTLFLKCYIYNLMCDFSVLFTGTSILSYQFISILWSYVLVSIHLHFIGQLIFSIFIGTFNLVN